MTFISSAKNSSGKEEVNNASIPTASTQVSPASANVVAANFSHDTVCAYIASQSNGSQIKYKDINQIDKDDTEEMDIKWSALIATRWATLLGSAWNPGAKTGVEEKSTNKSYMANKEENHALVADEEAPTEFALMAKSSSKNKVFDNSLCSKSCKKNTDSLNTKIIELSEKLSDTKTNLYHYKLGISQVEARLVEFKNQEIKFCKKIRGLEFKVESKDNRIERLTKELEELKKEKEGLDSKLTGFQSASKDLDTLLGSQRPLPSIESNSNDLQSSNSSVSDNEESSSSISSKPVIKFVKAADSPTACFKCGHFDHLAYDCGVWVEQGKTWAKNNYTHKSRSPRTVFYKTGRTPMRTNRPNMNAAQPKRTSFAKPAHSYIRSPFKEHQQ
nr:hypothetical protein [Tanacetum cinerariifolium]